jgi:hypothetical protein
MNIQKLADGQAEERRLGSLTKFEEGLVSWRYDAEGFHQLVKSD